MEFIKNNIDKNNTPEEFIAIIKKHTKVLEKFTEKDVMFLYNEILKGNSECLGMLVKAISVTM